MSINPQSLFMVLYAEHIRRRGAKWTGSSEQDLNALINEAKKVSTICIKEGIA